MPVFRCRFLDRRGQTIFTAIATADDLEGAKHDAFDALCGKELSLIMNVHGVEIYKGEQCIYPRRTQAHSAVIDQSTRIHLP